MIEAGELRPESPLRKACERAKTAVAIACYPDTERDLAKLIDEELRTSNLRIAPDARAVLMSLLGGDRQASRNELRKLALYAHGKGEITLDDVMTVVSDASELKLDPIVDGAFAGKPAAGRKRVCQSDGRRHLSRRDHLRRAAPGRMAAQIGACGGRRHAGLELCSRADIRACISPARAPSKSRCAISARRGWSAIIDQLGTAALDMRKQASLAAAIAQRTLLSIAANAKRRG